MSLSAKSAFRKGSAVKSRYYETLADAEIREYLEGCLQYASWELNQEEADGLAGNREYYQGFDFLTLVDWLKNDLRKSPGAVYMACRIVSGAEPDLRRLTQDWFAHRNIRRALSEAELNEIGASIRNLRELGIQWRWEARAFYSLYREVMDKSRVWGSSCQVNQGKVKALALTPNYNRLPLWVKKVLIESPQWIETDRIGNIWRFIDCAKAWKHAPELPKGIAEKVGRMSPRSRMLARWAWYRINTHSMSFRSMHFAGWEDFAGESFDRSEIVNSFWQELRRLQNLNISALIEERKNSYYSSGFSPEDHNTLRKVAEISLELPHGFLFEDWGLHRNASEQVYLEAIAQHGSPEQVCQNLFGNAGKRTIELFKAAKQDAWRWASAVCDGNADMVQKVLAAKDLISFESEAIEFLRSLPLGSRIRLLGATTFKYRGQVQPISSDHVRDTGYLWKNIQQKPGLGRIRCWFSVHETLAAAFVKELPDEVLPIPEGWEKVDGLCAVDGSWQIEFPKRVATLKYYGEVLRNCVGGYGPAIKSGRSVVFVVRENGILTHCVEIRGDYEQSYVGQFYQSGNSSPDRSIQESVEAALKQANLLG